MIWIKQPSDSKLFQVNKGCICRNTAVIIFLRHEDIAIVAPVCRPRILYQPVSLPIHGAVSNGKHCVIQIFGFIS